MLCLFGWRTWVVRHGGAQQREGQRQRQHEQRRPQRHPRDASNGCRKRSKNDDDDEDASFSTDSCGHAEYPTFAKAKHTLSTQASPPAPLTQMAAVISSIVYCCETHRRSARPRFTASYPRRRPSLDCICNITTFKRYYK